MRTFILLFVLASPLSAQLLGVKAGVVFPQSTLDDRPGYSVSLFAGIEPLPFQLNISTIALDGNAEIIESYISIPHKIHSEDYDLLLVPGLGMSWLGSYNINGVDKHRNAGLFRFDIRFLDDGFVSELGYKFSRVVGTQNTYVNTVSLSWGFVIDLSKRE